MNRVLSPQLTQTPQFDTYPLSEMYNYRPEPPKYQILRKWSIESKDVYLQKQRCRNSGINTGLCMQM